MEGGEIMNKQQLKDIFSGDKIDAYWCWKWCEAEILLCDFIMFQTMLDYCNHTELLCVGVFLYMFCYTRHI